MRADMPSEEVLSDLADLYKMFGDSTRLSILSSLRYHEYCVTHLAELLNMTTSAISHQLRILRASNLVRYRREGKQSFYSLADEHVEQIIDMGLEHILEE
ncbi:MAG: metalloregulator ArsR/SmtB family transcription factor [Eubacteriales bacterium]|nr:metalloregulator ArsR/SmtB family transcription factor [Eubacteriales bacterium]